MIFLQPKSLPELASCLAQKPGKDAYLVSGCTDFLAKRNGKVWDAEMLISLTAVPELRRINSLAALSSKAILAAEPAATLCGWPLSIDRFDEFAEILGVEIEHSIPNRPTMPYKRQAVRGPADDVLHCLIDQAMKKSLLSK